MRCRKLLPIAILGMTMITTKAVKDVIGSEAISEIGAAETLAKRSYNNNKNILHSGNTHGTRRAKSKGKGYDNDDAYNYHSPGKGKGKGYNDDVVYDDGYGKGKGGKGYYKSKSTKGYKDDDWYGKGKGSKGHSAKWYSKSSKGHKGGYGGYSKSSKESGKGYDYDDYHGDDWYGKGKGGYGGYSKSGKGHKGGYGGYSKSSKGSGKGYDYDDYHGDDWYGKGKGGYGGYSKSSKGSGKGYDYDDYHGDDRYGKGKGGDVGYSKSSKGYGKGYDYDDWYGKGKGGYGGYSKSSKGYGKVAKGHSKNSKGHKGGKQSKGHKGGKSGYGKGYGGYYGKAKKSKGWKSKKIYNDDYWDDYNDNDHSTSEPTYSQTVSPTVTPTVTPTTNPTVGDGIYHHENGIVGCHPYDSNGELIYNGKTEVKTIGFEFTMITNEDAEDNGGIEDEIQEVEYALAAFLAGLSDCKGHHVLSTHDRHLAAIGFDPAPADVIIDGAECGDGCSTIDSIMSITTDGGTSDEELCQLIEALSAYAEQYEEGTIEGVESLNIQSSTASVDGISCIQPEEDKTPPIVAKGIGAEEDDSSKDRELLPLLSLGLLLVAAALFVRRRRKNRSEDEEEERKRLQELSVQDIGNDEQLAFGAGYRNGALNAVNVHKCTSAQCTICKDNRKGTEFLPLENVDKWVNQQNTKIEGKSPGMPLETLPQEEHKDDLDGVEQETKVEERSRLIADAKRVLGEESASLDTVEADRLDDQLRGLPTLPEGPEDSDSAMPDTRRDKDTGSI